MTTARRPHGIPQRATPFIFVPYTARTYMHGFVRRIRNQASRHVARFVHGALPWSDDAHRMSAQAMHYAVTTRVHACHPNRSPDVEPRHGVEELGVRGADFAAQSLQGSALIDG